jgi:hypothetical protein
MEYMREPLRRGVEHAKQAGVLWEPTAEWYHSGREVAARAEAAAYRPPARMAIQCGCF